MKNKVAVVGLSALASILCACASPNSSSSSPCSAHSSSHKQAVPFCPARELQADVYGFSTLASETPDYLYSLRSSCGQTEDSRSIAAY